MKWFEFKFSQDAIKVLKEHLAKAIEEREKYKHDLIKLRNTDPTPRQLMESIFKKGIEWYDWNDPIIPIEDQRANFRDAKFMLESPLLNNIRNFVIATGTQAAFLEEMPDSQKVRDFSLSVNGIELLFNELRGVRNPDAVEEPTKNNIHNGV